MARRSSSQNRCHTDLLLVAAQRHRSGSSNNITRLAPDNSHRKDNIPDSTGPENRFSRCLCSSRTLLHLPISPTFPTHLSTPRDEETPGQDAQEISSPVPNASGHTISQDQLIQIFRDTIQLTGTTMERPGPAGDPRPRFSQHTCRVSGAQFLTRLGYSLEAVQLIGRWGSDHQTLHPRSPIAAPTCSQPQGTSTHRDDQPASP